ncbi:MAG: hypothetical protein H6663_10215 [Candidatus Promineofilum sp.]|nr:hypothetical protein [Promineifilum sp.]
MKPLNECHILVTPTSWRQHDPGLKTELAAVVGRVTYNETGKPLSSAQLAALLPGVDGSIAGLDAIDAGALRAAGALRVIARYGVGTDNVDPARRGRGYRRDQHAGGQRRGCGRVDGGPAAAGARPILARRRRQKPAAGRARPACRWAARRWDWLVSGYRRAVAGCWPGSVSGCWLPTRGAT